jgi:hypothetical protein
MLGRSISYFPSSTKPTRESIQRKQVLGDRNRNIPTLSMKVNFFQDVVLDSILIFMSSILLDLPEETLIPRFQALSLFVVSS